MIQYLAGIFDAEGYVRIRKTISNNKEFFTPEVKIYMCNKTIINEFSKLYNVPVKSSIRGNNRKTAYYVSLGVKKLKSTSFINDFLPYLNEKRIQLSLVRDFLEFDLDDKNYHYNLYMNAKKDFTTTIDKELSFEYLAGIIDGDGWLSMFNSGKGRGLYNSYSIGIEQRYKPLIQYFADKFGNKHIHQNKVYSNNHVQTWTWQRTTSDILPLLEGIEPFLIEKKKKCKIMIQYINDLEKLRKNSRLILNQW